MEPEIVFDAGERYFGYEDYLRKVHRSPMSITDVLPGTAVRSITRIFRAAMDLLADTNMDSINRKELFEISVQVYRVARHICKRIRIGELGTATAYIYLYKRGIKMIHPRNLSSLLIKIVSLGFRNLGNRFVGAAVERVSHGDVYLHRLLGVSVAWLSRRVRLSPSRLVECACRIASLVDPYRYPFLTLVSRFIVKPGLPRIRNNRYLGVTRILAAAGVKILNTDSSPIRAEFPGDLCIELRKNGIDVPRYVACI